MTAVKLAVLFAQLFCQTVLADSSPPDNIRSVLNSPSEEIDNDKKDVDLQTSDTHITSIVLPNGPGGTHHLILPPSYAKASEQSNARYSDDGYTTQTFVISGNNFSPIDDEFHRTIPPPLHATTYGPPQPVLFSNFRSKQYYPHRFAPARANGHHKFGFQPKEIFKPASHGPEPVKYHQKANQDPEQKTGPQLFHNEESYNPDTYSPNAGYSSAETYELPEEETEPQREHEIPSVRVNVDHSSKSREPFPGNRFYQDSFFDIKSKQAPKHSVDEESEEESESDDTANDGDYGNYVKYAPRHNYIPPSYHVIKPYLPAAKGVTKSYVAPEYVRGHYVQKFDQSYLEPNPPHPHLQPYYKRPLPIIQTQLPAKPHYTGYSDTYPYEPEYYGPYSEEKSSSIKDRFSTSSSDWTPINAPDGAVPAKSYDIPAPDLSRHSDKIFRRETVDHSIVIGKTKQSGKIKQKIQGNSEGVVSAVVRVKQ